MAADLSALKTAFTDYAAKVDAYVAAAEQHKVAVAKAVADAIAADDAAEGADLQALRATIDAAAAKVPAAPVAPVFEASNQ